MTALTERRKADRAKMAESVRALAVEMGASAIIEHDRFGDMSPQRVDVTIEAPRGLLLTVDFDGKSCQPDVHVLSWHISTKSDACLSNAFGNINTIHFHKSTDVAYGFDALCEILTRRLQMARDGSAFDAKREAASILKNGTAAEREARWAQYRAEDEARRAVQS